MPTDARQLQTDLECVTAQRDRAMGLTESAIAACLEWERRYKKLEAILLAVVTVSNKEREEHAALKEKHKQVVDWWTADINEFRAHAKASL